MKHICSNCRYYSAYYSQETCFYCKTSEGSCRKFRRASKRLDSCDSWEDNDQKVERKKRICLETLQEMAEQINMIMQILKETKKNLTD